MKNLGAVLFWKRIFRCLLRFLQQIYGLKYNFLHCVEKSINFPLKKAINLKKGTRNGRACPEGLRFGWMLRWAPKLGILKFCKFPLKIKIKFRKNCHFLNAFSWSFGQNLQGFMFKKFQGFSGKIRGILDKILWHF